MLSLDVDGLGGWVPAQLERLARYQEHCRAVPTALAPLPMLFHELIGGNREKAGG